MTRVFLDANVIVQSWTLDVLLSLAEDELFEPAWSGKVMLEARRAICQVRQCPPAAVDSLFQVMDAAFPEAKVTGWESAEGDIALPDSDDRHVAAAAIVGGCDVLLTQNVRDFPEEALAAHGIEPMPPDDFIMALVAEDEAAVLTAMRRVVVSKRRPPRSMEQEIEGLRRNGLRRFAGFLASRGGPG